MMGVREHGASSPVPVTHTIAFAPTPHVYYLQVPVTFKVFGKQILITSVK